ncbi:MAG TPA: hypothetical protein VND93_11430 [Myxococcales bacterium]|nr:hypothetical protein [Myxococcales bacterium]
MGNDDSRARRWMASALALALGLGAVGTRFVPAPPPLGAALASFRTHARLAGEAAAAPEPADASEAAAIRAGLIWFVPLAGQLGSAQDPDD